jgi:hypothetical protein
MKGARGDVGVSTPPSTAPDKHVPDVEYVAVV